MKSIKFKVISLSRQSCKMGLLFVLTMCWAGEVDAATWYVAKSGNDSNTGKTEIEAFLSIQKAIDNSSSGDMIVVASGSYDYISVPAEKAPITIKSRERVSDTIINGCTDHRCVTVGENGTTTNVYIEGFTLTGGRLLDWGNSGAGVMGGTYSDCIISNNMSGSGSTAGGAYKCTLNSCIVCNNSCSDWTGGMEECIASNCVIACNESTHVGAGGAVNCILVHCTITNNTTTGSAGGSCGACTLYGCFIEGNHVVGGTSGADLNSSTAHNCIIKATKTENCIMASRCYNCTIVGTANSPRIGRDNYFYNCIIARQGATNFYMAGEKFFGVYFFNCCLYDVECLDYVYEESSINLCPGFAGDYDYSLQDGSPCVDAGDNSYVSTDIDYSGNQRIAGVSVDIGAYEYIPLTCAINSISAVQRYPWNGFVDVTLDFTSSDTSTAVEFVLKVKNVEDNTITTCRSFIVDGVSTSILTFKSGKRSFVWNASADLPSGFNSERMKLIVETK